MSADQPSTSDLRPCEDCGQRDATPGETVRLVKYHPVNEAVEAEAGGASARPMFAVVCRDCGTPRAAVTREERHRLDDRALPDGAADLYVGADSDASGGE